MDGTVGGRGCTIRLEKGMIWDQGGNIEDSIRIMYRYWRVIFLRTLAY
jgi:hypothetical protein